ncbi:hypothetical protein [Algoriphagus resistens]|uniref:hypothetical protein n=1 Tax=Algoriphagus resistens TaxID=1750590 RepID=UPI000A8B75C1|nr:hypothetical protein [Algoriphagus resistens]
MKINKLVFLGIMCMLSVIMVQASSQPSPEYFEGKWAVLVKGTPNGDATIPVRFETVEGKTIGYFMEEGATEESKMSSVTISGDVVNTAFNISGYDVTLSLKKVDDDHAKGDLMGMFDAEGTRVK